jgi:uncharacterized protein (TIGR01777 family)
MRVVITGGTGMIGAALALSLANDGHEVIIASRNPRQVGPMPESIQFVEYDADTAEGWAHVVDGADAVVNLAAANLDGGGFFPKRWTDERKKEILNSRLDVGNAVVQAIEQAENKPRVLIQASAVDYYGVHPHNEVITESSPPGDGFLANVGKQWEASTAAVEDMGVRRCIIRTGLVLDNDQGVLPRFVFPFKLFVGGHFGNGKQTVPWIHLDDEVGAIRYLIENDNLSGPFNLTAPNAATNRELASTIGKVLRRPSLFWVPGLFFTLLFGEVGKLVLESQRAVPARLQEAGYTFKFPELEAALRDLY